MCAMWPRRPGPTTLAPEASWAWSPRDLQVTLADSVRWLFEQGHISRRQGGQLATA